MKRLILTLTALAAFVGGAFAAPNSQQQLGNLPWKIDQPGTYKAPVGNTTLYWDNTHSGPAVTITADNVTLNLNGCTLNVSGGSYGIFVNRDDYAVNPAGIPSNITIKNGMI